MRNKFPLQVQAASPKGAGQGAEKGAAGEKLGEWLISFKQTLQPCDKTGRPKDISYSAHQGSSMLKRAQNCQQHAIKLCNQTLEKLDKSVII